MEGLKVSSLDVFEPLIESHVDCVELDSLITDEEKVPDDPDCLDGRHPENLCSGLGDKSRSVVFSESRVNLSHFSRVTKGKSYLRFLASDGKSPSAAPQVNDAII